MRIWDSWLTAAFLACALILGIGVPPVSADNVLVVGVDERDWAGHYEWAAGELVGIDADVVREVAAHLGYTVRFRALPWARVLLMARERTLDGVLDLAPTEERRKYLHYVETPVSSETTVFWVKRGSPFKYEGYFDKSMRIGLLHGSDWSGRFAREGQPSVVRFSSFKAVFKSLVSGRVDAFGGHLTPTWVEVEEQGFVGQVEPGGSVENLPYYLAFTVKPGHGALARSFSKALTAYYAGDEYAHLLERHGITSKNRRYYPPPMIPPFEE